LPQGERLRYFCSAGACGRSKRCMTPSFPYSKLQRPLESCLADVLVCTKRELECEDIPGECLRSAGPCLVPWVRGVRAAFATTSCMGGKGRVRQRLWRPLDAANAYSFICSLPQGLETPVRLQVPVPVVWLQGESFNLRTSLKKLGVLAVPESLILLTLWLGSGPWV